MKRKQSTHSGWPIMETKGVRGEREREESTRRHKWDKKRGRGEGAEWEKCETNKEMKDSLMDPSDQKLSTKCDQTFITKISSNTNLIHILRSTRLCLFDRFLHDFSKVIQSSTTRNRSDRQTRGRPQPSASQSVSPHCHSRSGYDYWWWGADKKDSL